MSNAKVLSWYLLLLITHKFGFLLRAWMVCEVDVGYCHLWWCVAHQWPFDQNYLGLWKYPWLNGWKYHFTLLYLPFVCVENLTPNVPSLWPSQYVSSTRSNYLFCILHQWQYGFCNAGKWRPNESCHVLTLDQYSAKQVLFGSKQNICQVVPRTDRFLDPFAPICCSLELVSTETFECTFLTHTHLCDGHPNFTSPTPLRWIWLLASVRHDGMLRNVTSQSIILSILQRAYGGDSHGISSIP